MMFMKMSSRFLFTSIVILPFLATSLTVLRFSRNLPRNPS
jgi:hypothetical protein